MLVLSWAFAVRSGSSAVLADQPGDGPSTVDPSGHVDHFTGIMQRRAQGTALMRAVLVEVAFVLGQDRSQMPFTVDGAGDRGTRGVAFRRTVPRTRSPAATGQVS
jgi:hypothetical protein